MIAMNDYLPHVFLLRGRRLLYSHGVYALTGLTAALLILFGGVTDNLIPLFAIGAFLAFTLVAGGDGGALVQVGARAYAAGLAYVCEWPRRAGDGHYAAGGAGGEVYGGGLGDGAADSAADRHHGGGEAALYAGEGEMAETLPLNLENLQEPIVVIPMAGWDRIAEKAMRFGLLLSKEIKVVHVHSDDEPAGLEEDWETSIGSDRKEGLEEPELVMIPSNYRFIVAPLMDYVLDLEKANPGRKVAVLLPELVVRHWWENALHNQRVQLLKVLLLLKGKQRIVVVNIPWYL